VYDSSYYYIGTLGGTTTDGNIYVVWDLIGPDDTYYPDNTFEFVLTTVYTQNSGAMQPEDIGESSVMTPVSWKVAEPWSGPGDWVVANQQAWQSSVGADLLDDLADSFAQIGPRHGLTVRPTTYDQTSYRIGYGTSNEAINWGAFRNAIYNNLSRNLFYLGHGGPEGLGRDQSTTNKSILASEIAANLHTIPAGQTNKHKYRFVLLDGCSTASGPLCESFGIIHRPDVPGTNYINASVRPSAFVGWNSDQSAGFAGSINTMHVWFFQDFGYEWALGFGVEQALINARTHDNVIGYDSSDIKVFGFWGLSENTYNQQ